MIRFGCRKAVDHRGTVLLVTDRHYNFYKLDVGDLVMVLSARGTMRNVVVMGKGCSTLDRSVLIQRTELVFDARLATVYQYGK